MLCTKIIRSKRIVSERTNGHNPISRVLKRDICLPQQGMENVNFLYDSKIFKLFCVIRCFVPKFNLFVIYFYSVVREFAWI